MFFAVKSWNFVGLICLLFAEGFLRTVLVTGMASTSPSTTLKKKEALLFMSAGPVGWGGLVYGAYW